MLAQVSPVKRLRQRLAGLAVELNPMLRAKAKENQSGGRGGVLLPKKSAEAMLIKIKSGWLIESSRPYRLWFGHIQGFHRWWPHGHGLLHEPVEKFAPVLREATVEAEGEFVEIRL